MTARSALKSANEKFQSGALKEALELYKLAKIQNPKLESIANYNIELIKSKIKAMQLPKSTPQDKLLQKINKSRANITGSMRNSIRSKEMTLKILERRFDDRAHFDDAIYLTMHPDIEAAIAEGVFDSAEQHFELFGKAEKRRHSLQCYIDQLRDDVQNLKQNLQDISTIFSNEIWGSLYDTGSDRYDITSVPFYIGNSSHVDLDRVLDNTKIGVHLHLYYLDQLDRICELLNNIPLPFDLFISTPHIIDKGGLSDRLHKAVHKLESVLIEQVRNRGRDLAPFIIEFGQQLSGYDVICHIHTKKSEHTRELSDWGDAIFDSLLGSEETVRKIISLLAYDAKIVYPDGQKHYMKDPSGWADNYAQAKTILRDYLDIDIENFPVVEFPEGSMFWARNDAIAKLLNMPLEWDDFPEEPISTDGTLAHALERIILVCGHNVPGRIFKLIANDYIDDKLFYEDQRTYVKSKDAKNVKILSFYLPQFHPTPENDEWHGKGFTEWTKVKASSPLFDGHYQQHIPHPDIGYYLLDSPDVLQKQANQMKTAGVHGQIFYHYWFTGRLILEEPVKVLLKNKHINMPYCFCWANENWTKRWDGNDAEVLLAQHYSPEDARAFIEYLIPFLKDHRYIKIGGRPVLYIYRPSSMPNPLEYIEIWNEVCAAHGIPPLYVTAILTRGASDPRDYGMDGALERVLHDWTSENVPDIKDSLKKYWPVNGSVLPYDEVASYYEGQTAPKDFDYFRSLVPAWDNTPRYGSEAYIVHNSTPERFQKWLEVAIQYTKANLPDDRQFVVINAWNEWAEGAHLEPDTSFGYAYLNSVGRALSGVAYLEGIPDAPKTTAKPNIEIEIPEYLVRALDTDKYLNLRFYKHLAHAIRLSKLLIIVRDENVLAHLTALKCNVKSTSSKEISAKIQFRKPALVDISFITELVNTHLRFKDSVVISNEYGENTILQHYAGHDAVRPDSAYSNSVILIPNIRNSNTYKISHKSRTYATRPSKIGDNKAPEITTVIRFHKNDSLGELNNALMSLSAIHSCVVKPLICTQDLAPQQLKELRSLCDNFNYEGYTTPEIFEFYSENRSGDIRAKLLHEGLNAASTRYVGFLDHDDLMLPDSYSWLVNRLSLTNKAATFGRVFDTKYESKTQKFIKRNRTYEYGYSYEEFFEVNHAPLHSFLLDKTKLDLDSLHYFDDQKFMEDYYLSLQLLGRDNTDWQSLHENFYVGDYIHSTDRSHTLAISDITIRGEVTTDLHFEKCKNRVELLKAQLQGASARLGDDVDNV